MFERGFVADVVDDDLDGSLRAAAIAERSAPSNDPHWILTIPTASEREAMLERYAGWSRERYQANGRYYNRHLPDGSFGDWKLGHLDPSLANRSGVAYYGYGGFWDLCGYTMAMAYANLTLPRKLLIGPWHHGNWKFSEQQEHLRWLDFHLKGIDNGIMTEPPVTYATSHPELPLRWHSAESFPPAGTTERRFHGRLTSDSKRGRLSEEPVSESRSAAFAVNYDVTSGLASRNWGYNVGPFLHLDALEPFRDQILTLLTDPFEEEVEITGFPTVELTIATTGDSGAVFLYLQDLAPDGSAYYLSDGQLNLCHRKLSEPEFSYLGLPYHSAREADRLAVVPNEKMRVAIALHPVSWRIPKGHRFALTISGADYDNSFQARQTPAAVHTVFAGGESPLVLSLPVMEVGKRPAQIPGAFAGLRAKATRAQRPTLTSWSP
jgi:putative CocE/NonD family hydrolase